MTDSTDMLLVMGSILAGSWIFLIWTLLRERRLRTRSRVTWYERYQQRQTRQRK